MDSTNCNHPGPHRRRTLQSRNSPATAYWSYLTIFSHQTQMYERKRGGSQGVKEQGTHSTPHGVGARLILPQDVLHPTQEGQSNQNRTNTVMVSSLDASSQKPQALRT